VEFRLKIFGCFVEGWLKGYMVSGVGVGYEKRFWIQGL